MAILSSKTCTLSCADAANHLKTALNTEFAEMKGNSSEFETRLQSLCELFSLTSDDAALLMMGFCYGPMTPLEALIDSIPKHEMQNFISIATKIPVRRLRACWTRKSRLLQCELVTREYLRDSAWSIQVDDSVFEYLSGTDSESLAARYFETSDTASYATSSFGIPLDSLSVFENIINSHRPCNIMLYGKPGTGKTELAKAITTKCGKTACFVRYGETNGKPSGRRVALEATINLVQPDHSVVVVDEADSLLNTRYSFLSSTKESLEKGWLNDFLERSRVQIIWITNDVHSMEESTRRRFSYSIQFHATSSRQQETIWREHLKDHPLRETISEPLIRTLSREYSVGAAGIANTLNAMRHLDPSIPHTQTEVESTARQLLESHQQLTGSSKKRGLISVLSQYDLDAVNTDIPPNIIIKGLQQTTEGRISRAKNPANLLFWGPPGTGKTAFAQYLAATTGMELLVKRASDLLNMYVGGTEANISAAFKEAERENAILFLDEADSFFIRRDTAIRSWETSQTNELLTQMENHHGVLICCTNLQNHLDHAAMRRFAWKVRFLPLRPEGKVRLYRKYFETPSQPLPIALIPQIEGIANLTPGDIKAIWQQNSQQEPGSWSHEQIISALESEVSYKLDQSARIGF
jgi:SpoVK/Ycf46/Vps4 family AAA+-type ATPase